MYERYQTAGKIAVSYLKLLHGCMIHVLAACCLLFSFSSADLLPKSFIASLLSEAWKNEKIWLLKPES